VSGEALPETTSDERVMAAIAHLFGVAGALIVWALQKDKSGFVRFQAVQALAFSVLTSLVTMAAFACMFGMMMLAVAAGTYEAVSNPPQDFPAFMVIPFGFPFLMFTCMMPFSLVIFACHLIAAFSVASGRDFRYPWLGRRVEGFLNS